MPSLPRIRRFRASAEEVVRSRRDPAELSSNGLTWVHLDAPDQEEATALAERFGWHPLDVEDVLSKRQRPKVDEYDEYFFAVLHFPFHDKAIQRLNAAELDVFVGHGYLVTLPNVELLPVTRLFERASADPELRDNVFGKGSGYLLYHVLDDLFDYCFPILDKIGHKLDSIEDDIEEARFEEIILELFKARQQIVSYTKIIKPQRPALRILERRVERFLPEELELYFDELVNIAEEIVDQLELDRDRIDVFILTNEALIGHQQSAILRILTMFTAVLLPLTLIAAVAALDFRHNLLDGIPGGFYNIVGAMVLTVVVMLAFFRKNRWM